jgi:hypothetical protein
MGGQQLPINLSGAIVALMLVLAALLNQPPLQSQRPPTADIKPEPSGPHEAIPARSWEDPFEAVKRSAPAATKTPEPRANCRAAAAGTSGADGAAERLDCTGPAQPASEPPVGANIVHEYLQYLGTTAEQTRLLILPIMVSGAPQAGLREARLRRRVAAHAGLHAAGFLPLRADRIGVWTWQPSPGFSLDVPFEAFAQQLGSERRIVLLLWLNDAAVIRDLVSEMQDAAGDGPGIASFGPLAMIDRLLGAIDYPDQRLNPGTPYHRYLSSAVRLIGPADSDGLDALYVELLGWSSKGAGCAGAYSRVDSEPDDQPRDDFILAGATAVWGDRPINFAVVSPFATAPWWVMIPSWLDPGQEVPAGRVEINRDGQRCATVGFHRTITSDDVIISALVDELIDRGIDPTAQGGHAGRISRVFAGPDRAGTRLIAEDPRPAVGSRDHIVLVAEWDTKFGRALPLLFEREVARRWCEYAGKRVFADDASVELGECHQRIANAWSPPWIHRFSYLRGLDGEAPASIAVTGQEADILALATGAAGGLKEPAIGTNQFDYLRRLAEQVEALDWSLKRQGQGSIKAFGILGTDYFDKLAILQALKERFPSHLYFTTDLDAGFLEARVFRWTRNLVIAAPFDLTLRRSFDGDARVDLQGMVPPFRDSYQTSLFHSVRNTVEGNEATLSLTPRAPSDTTAPNPDAVRLFEVGYGRFFGLASSDPVSAAAGGSSPPTTATPGVHPDPWQAGIAEFAARHLLVSLIGLALALAAALAMVPSLRRQVSTFGAGVGALVRCWPHGRPHDGDAARARDPGLASSTGLAPPGAGEPAASVDTWAPEVAELACPRVWAAVAIVVVTGIYLAVGVFGLAPLMRGLEPFTWFGGVSIWPSELIRLVAGWVAWLCLILGLYQIRCADDRIRHKFELSFPDPASCPAPGFASWSTDRSDAEPAACFSDRVHRLLDVPAAEGASTHRPRAGARPKPHQSHRGSVIDADREWSCYGAHASLQARSRRVLPAALLLLGFAVVIVYGFVDPISPHRGEAAYWFSLFNGWVLVALPFTILLMAAVDEALLCSGLLHRLADRDIEWPQTKALGADLVPEAESRQAVAHWITTEFIADRTGPAATVIHLPFIVILPLLLSFSTRFDNWNTPVTVIGLLVLAIGIGFWASLTLRGTARRIRKQVVERLEEEVTGIEYAAAKTRSERLRKLVQRIEAVHNGAYTEWYNEPIFRALIWVLAIGVLVITEYARVGG